MIITNTDYLFIEEQKSSLNNSDNSTLAITNKGNLNLIT